MSGGVPGLMGIEHVGLTVPDLDAAVRFFVDVLGCEPFYDLGPFEDVDGWLQRQLNVPAGTVMRRLRFLRCGHGPNLELFEYETTAPRTNPPRNSDAGGHHLAFYVEDLAPAIAHLEAEGVRVLGAPVHRKGGPSGGQSWIYFLTPWGLQCELVSFPGGKAYERGTSRRLWNPRVPAQ